MLRSFVFMLLFFVSGSYQAERAESAVPRMTLAEAVDYLCSETPVPAGHRLCSGYVLFENGRVYRMDRIHASGEVELVRYSTLGFRHVDIDTSLRVSEAMKIGEPGYEVLRYRYEEQGIER